MKSMTAFIKKQVTVHFVTHFTLKHPMQDPIPTHCRQKGINMIVIPSEQPPKPQNQKYNFLAEDHLKGKES
jgi:hypothetical protein